MGQTKYQTTLSAVKAVLTLANANADMERKFSDRSETVTVWNSS